MGRMGSMTDSIVGSSEISVHSFFLFVCVGFVLRGVTALA